MKLVGIIGGMSWESTAEYYRLMNEFVREELGGLHSARLLVYSFDFAGIGELQEAGDWEAMADELVQAAHKLEGAGADLVLIATNTMHRVAPEVQQSIQVPLLHIADATAEASRAQGLDKLGLLGTRFTMEQGFYKDRLRNRHGLEVIIPGEKDRQLVHDVIFEELCQGIISENSRQAVKRIIEKLVSEGAEGIVLGCTELPLLIREEEVGVVRLDTTTIHARAAVEAALV
jgi:aspartate racemase